MGWTAEWTTNYLQRHPAVLRTLVRIANELGATPKSFFTRAVQVRAIFERSHDFQVGYTIAPRTKLGAFLLSMDEGPRHSREKRALKRAVDRSTPSFKQVAAQESETLAVKLAQAHVAGRIEIGSSFAERVFVRSLARCFGLPLAGWHSDHLDTEPGERTLALFIRTLGGTIGTGAPATFGLEQLADRVAPDFKQQLDAVIGRRRAELAANPQHAGNTVIDWVLAPRPDHNDPNRAQVEGDAQYVQIDGLTRSVAGLLAAGASFPKAFSNVLFELARHNKLRELALASQRIAEPNAWGELAQAYVLEALRFRPAFPLLTRYCPRATALGDKAVPAGDSIGFLPLAAMFDPAAVERPEVFIHGRPKDVYYIFGAGARACLGQTLMLELFPPMLRALFTHLPAIAEMTGGEFRYDGAALESFWVTLGRAARASKPSGLRRVDEDRDSDPPLAAAGDDDSPAQISVALTARSSSVPPAPCNIDRNPGGS